MWTFKVSPVSFFRFKSSITASRTCSLSGNRSILSKKPIRDIHPKQPARTRFAPSPTGKLHLGSLRTALYNFLLAKSTGGQFLLRLEDTDQKRLVPGAEKNIYDSLSWCGISYDEGPGVNEAEHGPFRQSDRTAIYQKYIARLLSSGHAYRCFCSKERLDGLRESAQNLMPPTTVSYDRNCAHISENDIQERLKRGTPYTIRLKSPETYPGFTDLLHGSLNMQPQVNAIDKRFDDPILVKSDSLPTYHFANVVDDHLMEITHVVRGEEWLPSTPKHIALYEAFGWAPPEFIHIPLLTSTSDKKLSKRKGDADVMTLREKGVLPEALINFSALFGWSPPREEAAKNHECFRMQDLIRLFNLNNLTKGNAKVDEKKLWFFNKQYLSQRLQDPVQADIIASDLLQELHPSFPDLKLCRLKQILNLVGSSLTTVKDLQANFHYLLSKPQFENNQFVRDFIQKQDLRQVQSVLQQLQGQVTEHSDLLELIDRIAQNAGIRKNVVFEAARFALAASIPGVKLPLLVDFLGAEETNTRVEEALDRLELSLSTGT
ncbi:LANO_0D09098g1_1 [Lachancea nothofagi CBS 11611]|uniref:Glutamate--tRNA ligase, mitochondrial n=1 Tax=Lachancea nothofagi CBS 11611 TaxID=1266666 RepID=A0A1G4JJN7_9SACH|nr:LANO_0D09098g1_1 [Lachancea nothofagi CBS 11611]